MNMIEVFLWLMADLYLNLMTDDNGLYLII